MLSLIESGIFYSDNNDYNDYNVDCIVISPAHDDFLDELLSEADRAVSLVMLLHNHVEVVQLLSGELDLWLRHQTHHIHR